MNEFDIKAAEWDRNPVNWERSAAIVEEIKKRIPLSREMSAMEYGAGTGIASFLLKDQLNEITLMDNSKEMIRIIREKIKAVKAENLKAINFDLEHKSYNKRKFDFIFTQLVLHHVTDIEAIIAKFTKMLNEGGILAIADLYEEDGSFHGEGFTGHNGFDPEKLSQILRKNQFTNIYYKSCFIIEREGLENELKQYDMFLLTARRNKQLHGSLVNEN